MAAGGLEAAVAPTKRVVLGRKGGGGRLLAAVCREAVRVRMEAETGAEEAVMEWEPGEVEEPCMLLEAADSRLFTRREEGVTWSGESTAPPPDCSGKGSGTVAAKRPDEGGGLGSGGASGRAEARAVGGGLGRAEVSDEGRVEARAAGLRGGGCLRCMGRELLPLGEGDRLASSGAVGGCRAGSGGSAEAQG
jgi:hypothetical protein